MAIIRIGEWKVHNSRGKTMSSRMLELNREEFYLYFITVLDL